MSGTSSKEAKASTAEPAVTQKAGSDPTPDPRDAILARYKVYESEVAHKRHHEVQDHAMRVDNLPVDKTVTWALDPRQDGGGHMGLIQQLGFRPVYVDEVTTNPYVDDKLVVTSYIEHPNGFVAIGDRILMIGYRQYRDQRRQANSDRSRRALDNAQSDMSNLGVEVERDRTESGPITRA
jgi:hypothetical protein